MEDFLTIDQEGTNFLPIPGPQMISEDLRVHLGNLLHIQDLRMWPLYNVLREKYKWPEEEAISFTSFLLPMLALDPQHRATAAECLMHPWLQDHPPPPAYATVGGATTLSNTTNTTGQCGAIGLPVPPPHLRELMVHHPPPPMPASPNTPQDPSLETHSQQPTLTIPQ